MKERNDELVPLKREREERSEKREEKRRERERERSRILIKKKH